MSCAFSLLSLLSASGFVLKRPHFHIISFSDHSRKQSLPIGHARLNFVQSLVCLLQDAIIQLGSLDGFPAIQPSSRLCVSVWWSVLDCTKKKPWQKRNGFAPIAAVYMYLRDVCYCTPNNSVIWGHRTKHGTNSKIEEVQFIAYYMSNFNSDEFLSDPTFLSRASQGGHLGHFF